MNIVIEDRPQMVAFGVLQTGDYFVTDTGALFRKKDTERAHRVTGAWPQLPLSWFSPDYHVFKAEITAIHVKVVG